MHKWSGVYCILHEQISLAVMSLCHDTETTTAAACDTASHDAICKLFINALIILMSVYTGNARVLTNLQLAPINISKFWDWKIRNVINGIKE